MSDFSLDGKSAIVAGGGAGLLPALLALGQAGAHLSIQAHGPGDLAAADAARSALGADAVTVARQEVTDFASADKLVAQVAGERGSVDVLLAPAPPGPGTVLADLDEATWSKFVARYLKGVVGLTRAATRLMAEQEGGGAVVTFAASTTFFAPGTARAIAGAAMLSLTSATAGSLAGRGVTANCVVLATGGYQGGVPQPRAGTEADMLGPTVAFLCSPAAAGVSGRYIYCGGSDVGLFTKPMVMENANVQVRFDGQPGPADVGNFVLPLVDIGKA